ncbi:MAG: sulfurtransferase TusA family protein [Nitrospinae bacterium]|nr:sulfurtransferase TusA family protein [Nitrospinota bacterium]
MTVTLTQTGDKTAPAWLDDFRESVEKRVGGLITEEQFKGERLKYGIYAQRQLGYHLVRTKILAGRLSAPAFNALADAADRYGDGGVHLTSRHDAQFYYVKLESLPDILEALHQAGITTEGASGNTLRNMTHCDYSGACAKEIAEVAPLTEAVSRYFLGHPLSRGLPRKIKITFSGCSDDCASAFTEDLGFIAVKKTVNGVDKTGFRLLVGGGQGPVPRLGRQLEEFVEPERINRVILAILTLFNKYGPRANRSRARIKFYIESVGFEKFKQQYIEELNALGDVAPFNLPDLRPKAVTGETIHAKVPSGDLSSAQLRLIGELVSEHPGVEAKITKTCDLLFSGIPKSAEEKFKNELTFIGLLASKRDCGACVFACRGASSCSEGITNTQALSKEIWKLAVDTVGETEPGMTITADGCTNACVRHHTADVGLQGAAKRINGQLVPHYQFYIGGTPKGENPAFSVALLKVPAKRTPEALAYLLNLIKTERKQGETTRQLAERKGAGFFVKELSRFASVPTYEENPGFYRDYGMDHDFTLEDVRPGECAGAAQDMIDGYFTDARTCLLQAKVEFSDNGNGNTAAFVRKAVGNVARALLSSVGLNPPDGDDEAIRDFTTRFVARGLVSDERLKVLTSTGPGAPDMAALLKAGEGFLEEVYAASQKLSGKSAVAKEEAVPGVLDLSGVKCPFNYVKVKLALEGLSQGTKLSVILDDGSPIRNVPASLSNDGHKVVSIDAHEGGRFLLTVEKA